MQSFVDVLNQEFQDPEVKKQCIEASLEKIQKGMVTRTFDVYPSLLNQEDFNSLDQEFRQLYKHITECGLKNDKLQLFNRKDQIALKQWEEKIIEIACRELFDEKGKIKNAIVKLLGWEAHLAKIPVWALLSAFVGAVNHQVMANVMLTTEQIKNDCIFTYINPNRLEWVKKKMRAANYPLDYPDEDTDELILQKVGIGIGAGVLVTGLLVTGILLFSSKNSSGGGGGMDFIPKHPSL